MIRSFYHHGMEIPATDLTPDQMRAALADAGGVLWVDMINAGPQEADEILAGVFGFDPVSISDCLEDVRHPKLDDYGNYVFFAVHANEQDTASAEIDTVELDVYLGPNFVVTHHPLPLAVIDRVIERVLNDELLVNLSADQLVHTLLASVESDYRPTVGVLSAAITGVEIEVLTAPTRGTLRRMYELRHAARKMKRVLAPQQEIMGSLATRDLRPIRAINRSDFRKLADRIAEMVETADTLGEYVRDAMEIHHSVVASQTHSLLRRVAIMLAVVLPLTWLVVLYGSHGRLTSGQGTLYADLVLTVGVLMLVAILATYFYRS